MGEQGMAEIVNLRTARKRAKRQQHDARAAVNRLEHGRSKSERALTKATNDKASQDLGRHRIDTGDRR
jgi:hypothetical protein